MAEKYFNIAEKLLLPNLFKRENSIIILQQTQTVYLCLSTRLYLRRLQNSKI